MNPCITSPYYNVSEHPIHAGQIEYFYNFEIMLSEISIGQILGDSTYMKCFKKYNSQKDRVEWWLPRKGEQGSGRWYSYKASVVQDE